MYRLLFLLFFSISAIVSCTSIDLYEKNVAIPNHRWESSFKPEFNFTIKDTTATYQLYLVLRHTEKYNYNNIWINLSSIPPHDTLRQLRYELPLATNEKGWLATAMDDIYEHRIPLTNPQHWKAGNYTFKLEQVMREDPLQNVLDVGLRVEKK